MNADKKYLHLFKFLTDHNGYHAGIVPDVLRSGAFRPSIFPKKGNGGFVIQRKFREDKKLPRTVTAQIRCCGRYHKITLGLDGKMTLHDHTEGVEALQAMKFFGDEKTRCLEVLEAWNTVMSPTDYYDMADIKKIIPAKFHPIVNWLERRQNYHSSYGEKYRCAPIHDARRNYSNDTWDRSGNFYRSPHYQDLKQRVHVYREKIIRDYFGDSNHDWKDYWNFPKGWRIPEEAVKDFGWFKRVRSLGLHEAPVLTEIGMYFSGKPLVIDVLDDDRSFVSDLEEKIVLLAPSPTCKRRPWRFAIAQKTERLGWTITRFYGGNNG